MYNYNFLAGQLRQHSSNEITLKEFKTIFAPFCQETFLRKPSAAPDDGTRNSREEKAVSGERAAPVEDQAELRGQRPRQLDDVYEVIFGRFVFSTTTDHE